MRFAGRSRTPLDVACSADRDWLVHCATMLHSLITRQSAPVRIHFVCSDGLAAAAVAPLKQMVERLGGEFTIRPVSRRDLGALSGVGWQPFYRVMLPDLLSDLDRVLYLDSDLIVTDSLAPLCAIDLSSHWIGAVSVGFLSPEWGEKHCAGLGLPSGQRYFNAGVLLMNLHSLREDGCVGRVREHVRTHPGSRRAGALRLEGSPDEFRAYVRDHPGELLFWEQDSLNAVLGQRRLELDPRWNLMNAFRFPAAREPFGERTMARACKRPAIRHFEGVAEDKPWHPGTEVEGRELYWRHRRKTPWPDASRSAAPR